MKDRRAPSRTATGSLLLAAAIVAGTAVAIMLLHSRSPADTPTVAPATATAPSADTPGHTAPPATTTTIVVEQIELPEGVHEFATVRPDRREVRVRRMPPARWDHSLTPVVTSTGVEPPRSGKDVTREALPNESVPITGRRVTELGWVFDNPTAFEPPQPLVFGVVQRQGRWIEVQVPVRPNGTTGWILDSAVDVASTTRSIEITLSDRRLRLLDDGSVLLEVPVGIGRPATPTPTGSFTVTDVVPSADPTGGYGPIALALDGYSESLDRFGGEEGAPGRASNVPVLAIHGTNRPGSVGQAQSNGCPRLDNDDMVRLASIVPAGTPVRIWP